MYLPLDGENMNRLAFCLLLSARSQYSLDNAQWSVANAGKIEVI